MSSEAVRHLRWSLPALLVACAVITTAPAAQQPVFYPDDPLAIDDDMSLDASGVVPVEDSNAYDFVINTFGSPGHRHDVRAGNVNTIDQPYRPGDHVARRPRRRTGSVQPDHARRVGRQPGQVDRRPARVPDDRPDGAPLPDRSRPSLEPGDGYGSRDHRHGLLPRVRLPRRRDQPGRTRPGRDRDCARRADCRSAAWGTASADAARHRRRAATRGTPAQRPLPGTRQPVRRRPASRQLPLLRNPARRSE